MQVFYSPDINGKSYTLNETESKHIIKVMRMKKNDSVMLIDGKGNLYEGVISEPDIKRCVIEIKSVTKDFAKRDYRLHIAISTLKNPDRFEWFVEKAVEIGVDEITPIISHATEKTNIKEERIRNIIISAMKQSLKATDTILNPVCKYDDLIKQPFGGTKMIAHCNTSIDRSQIGAVYNKGENALILIGPEGDFTPTEIKAALDNGFTSIHLGDSRLRTETAGIAACHSIYFLNQN